MGHREYRGIGGAGPAGGGPDLEGCAPCGTAGGAMGGFRWVCFFGDADWPGLGGHGGGWAGVTNSSPNSSDSSSDGEIGRSFFDARLFFASFAGNRVSLNFTSWEFQCDGGLHPRTGIPWNLVHNQRRSFLGSLVQVLISSF